MKRTYLVLLIAGFAIAGLASGYWLGLRQGVDFGDTFATALRGSGSLDSLRALEKGKINLFTDLVESQIDQALYQNYYLEAHPAFRFMPAVWGADVESVRRESLTRLATYRKEHPSPLSRETLEARHFLPALNPSQLQTMSRMQEAIAEMVGRYSAKIPKGP
jgi:hypothetical protein